MSSGVTRKLIEAGLGHIAHNFANVSEAAFANLLMQDYAKYNVVELGDKQKLFRLIKSVQASQDGLSATPLTQRSNASQLQHTDLLDLGSSRDDFLSDFATGFDTQASPHTLLGHVSTMKPPTRAQTTPLSFADLVAQEQIDPNPPKIRVVVRKRPLNDKEHERQDEDIIQVFMKDNLLVVNEPKVKVDLTKYTERHVFAFDAALNEAVSNDEVYRSTVQPLVGTLFRGGKATCFAYGQTGSGKTFTMRPLPLRAAEDIFSVLRSGQHPGLELHVSCFEIYGGKLFDLLNERKRLDMREDGKKNVCIVGLEEHNVHSLDDITLLTELSSQHRSTGSTGANADSSRSHSIMQFALKRQQGARQPPKMLGKLSFIDLAGSERGADTYDNDKQTRLEGAEINKSLLALKECIRALDCEQRHIPFRGSKLTEVLRDSFVGAEARTVMIANVSPTSSSCEHTLNTLRYADRVKELRKGQRNSSTGSAPVLASDIALPPAGQILRSVSDGVAGSPPRRGAGLNLKNAWGGYQERATHSAMDSNANTSTVLQQTQGGAGLPRAAPPQQQQAPSYAPPQQQQAPSYAPPQQQPPASYAPLQQQPPASYRPPPLERTVAAMSIAPQHRPQPSVQSLGASSDHALSTVRTTDNDLTDEGRSTSTEVHEWTVDHLLEAEDELVLAHRKHIEDSMALVRAEMGLLGEVDQPGSSIKTYVEHLGQLLEQKAAGVRELQLKVLAFRHAVEKTG